MIPKAVPLPAASREESGPAATHLGVDVGTSLVKLAIRSPGGELELRLANRTSDEALAETVRACQAELIGLSGSGASALAKRLGASTTSFGEFDAWAAGARALHERSGTPAPNRFLLVSIGTGTSAILTEPDAVTRIGGSALGGGTIAGLSAALLGTSDFDTVVTQAGEGDRWAVDLPVSEVYPDGAEGLIAVNAASFAKLAREPGPRAAGDLASAVLSLVGENIGFICAGLARAVDVEAIVYGGTTLRRSSPLQQLLAGTAAIHGRRAVFLEDGAFTGAVGALVLAEA